MQGDARPGAVQHAQIIGPIANGDHLSLRDTQPGGYLLQRLDLGLPPQYRALNVAGQLTV